MSYEAQIKQRTDNEARLLAEIKRREMTPRNVEDFLNMSKAGAAGYTFRLRELGLIAARQTSSRRIVFYAADGAADCEDDTPEIVEMRHANTRKAALKNADVQAKIVRNWFGGAV
jgi:hypothetical protein